MDREKIIEEIRSTLGTVPEEVNELPDEVLENDWPIMKLVMLREVRIPLKYKQLIGLAAAAVLGNRRLCFFHRELAKHFGATEEEIRETLNVARFNAGQSALIAGAGIDIEKYRNQTKEIVQHLRQRKAA
ncbi:MAG TPA: carboxymuconolactone decarboxylase family protein [Armatimonadota bacterium]|nr:carboxymuconolactone decarboxylase family protein [Armatimonadota bacterium]